MKWCVKVDGGGWHAVNKICGGLEGVRPKAKGHGSLMKECKTGFDNMTMFAFGGADVFRCVGRRCKMLNTKFSECVG